MTTDLKIFERIKDNPPGKRGIRRAEIWDSEVDAVLPAGWINTDRESRPGERTVVLAQVCKGIESSWWEKTPEGFEEHHKMAPCRPVRRLKLVTLNAASEVVGIDYVCASGYSTDDFRAVAGSRFAFAKASSNPANSPGVWMPQRVAGLSTLGGLRASHPHAWTLTNCSRHHPCFEL
jgi:hypothetical protein